MPPIDVKIVVAGDVCVDSYAIPILRKQSSPTTEAENWRLRDGWNLVLRAGGAWVLEDIVKHIVGAGTEVSKLKRPDDIDTNPPVGVLKSFIELKEFKKSHKSKDSDKKVWRVDQFRGFSGPEDESTYVPALESVAELSPNVIILDDAGNGFREENHDWLKAMLQRAKSAVVLWKLSRPYSEKGLHKLLLENKDRVYLVLEAEDLRAAGASIGRRLSWERAIEDVRAMLRDDPQFAALGKFKNLIIRFELEGALEVTNWGVDAPAFHLYYVPEEIEGQTRSSAPGIMFGITNTFVAQIAKEMVSRGTGTPPNAVQKGITRGLARTRLLFQGGFGTVEADADLQARLNSMEEIIADSLIGLNVESERICFTEVQFPPNPMRELRLIDPLLGTTNDIIHEIAVSGIKRAVNDAPRIKYEKLETLDRLEIESYRSIHRLIRDYLAAPSVERPLSIAVFGPPGSGKSFGVTNIAESLGGKGKLEFNVSQFESAQQLTKAFHIIRDSAVRGEVPLVFFDEFDAKYEGQPLGWLRQFLAPMQDGKFVDGDSVHYIGKAIFVFAGGTATTYDDFTTKLKDEDERIAAKLPDFASRLRGSLDIIGINRSEERPQDLYLVRRAVILRNSLLRKAPQLFGADERLRMDPGVLRAFLHCRKYRHGTRSMEAIIDMSSLVGQEEFQRSCLPPLRQLELHVHAEEFMDLVKRGTT